MIGWGLDTGCMADRMWDQTGDWATSDNKNITLNLYLAEGQSVTRTFLLTS